MKRVTVKMNRTVEQLVKGETYNLPSDQASQLISQGAASKPGENNPGIGPTEIKPAVGPSATKQPVTEASIVQPKKNA